MRKLKIFSTAALILGGIMLTMPFAGCGQKEYEDNENTVVIDFFKGDYGIDFINNLCLLYTSLLNFSLFLYAIVD